MKGFPRGKDRILGPGNISYCKLQNYYVQYMRLNLNVIQIQPFEYTDLTPLHFLFVRLDVELNLRNLGGELLARISVVAASIKKREDQLRRTTRDLRTRDGNRAEVDGEIFDHLL